MRTLFSGLLALCLAVALASAGTPLQARALHPTQEMSCCAGLKMNPQPNDCGHQAPKSPREERCCANCLLGMSVVLPPPLAFSPPDSARADYFLLEQRALLRAHRPPVPPPRAPLA